MTDPNTIRRYAGVSHKLVMDLEVEARKSLLLLANHGERARRALPGGPAIARGIV